ncbi:hypothetical protein [Halomonas sp. BC04]|uniref:hypothetical protein n=1 Tax=Halomonas sp. BC04 TaxID=1403540 RepID=UPI0003ED7339|nr:hypothetical protein [Halomonas sp. BC04]EWG99835.1 hypothetical protein Q427_22685 [Halomonas sp. BC04]
MSDLKFLLLPPSINVLLVLLGLMLGLRRLTGALLVLLGLVGLLALSTPTASHALRQGLETYSVPIPSQLRTAQAIVILGGGRDYDAPEFGWEMLPPTPPGGALPTGRTCIAASACRYWSAAAGCTTSIAPKPA